MTMTAEIANERPNVYLAGPLFSAGERAYNTYLKHCISQVATTYLPQEDGLLIIDLIESGMSGEKAAKVIFQNDVNAIHRCDILLILLDGRAVDEGAAFELGLAYALGKKCIGLQTDFRRLSAFGNNPMISGPLIEVFSTPEQAVSWIRKNSTIAHKTIF